MRVPWITVRAVLCVTAAAAAASGAAAQDAPPHSPDDGRPGFAAADKDGDGKINRGEAAAAGLTRLLEHWQQADKDGNGTLNRPEYAARSGTRGGTPASPQRTGTARAPEKTVGKGQFKSPETALWDQRADVYLVSNVNGPLTALDDNGFISRLSPDGSIMALKWIEANQPGVTLHGPKGMMFVGDHLIVADVKAVRYFDRLTGKPVRTVDVPDAYMLNDLAVDERTGTLYVTDTGSATADHPGAVYRLLPDRGPDKIAEGRHLDRPDGLLWRDGGLLVTPFGAHARDVYRLTTRGEREPFASVPGAQLDGLIALPDGSITVTSWKGNAVYRISGSGGNTSTLASGIVSPAQLDYDSRRQRLLVPVLKENELHFYPYTSQ